MSSSSSSSSSAVTQLISIFESTQSSDTNIIKSSESQLRQYESQSGYSMIIIQLLASNEISLVIRQAAATAFKNWILHNWVKNTDETTEDENKQSNTPIININEQDRIVIKQNILNLMISTPSKVQSQLSQALAIISQADFPHNWQNLLPDLVQQIKQHAQDKDQTTLQGLLETAGSIFYHYRIDMRSDRLWSEIKYVLDNFADPLTKLIELSFNNVAKYQTETSQLIQTFKTLNLVIQIFYSLNYQDIPEYFETNMQEWMTFFVQLLKYNNPSIPAHDEPGVVDIVHSSICECLELYASKYEEQFKQYVGSFVQTVWELLQSTNTNKRYDHLVTTAIKFLTSIVKKEQYKQLFSSEDALKTISERVIIPQLKLRQTEIELFEDDPVEFIRVDIEGSDVDTRRRTTMDFIRALLIHFESQITAILKNYVNLLIKQYESTPNRSEWLAKDCAMYIILALAAKSQTQAKGITEVNQFLDVGSFFTTQVIPELKTDSPSELTSNPILKADCLKFISNFRSHLPVASYPQLLQLLGFYLNSTNYVLHTYSANCIEKLLAVKDEITQTDPNNPNKTKIISKLRMDKNVLKPSSEPLLKALFKQLDSSLENEYLMRCLMRLCSVGQEIMLPSAPFIINNCTKILSSVAKNPSNPQFNHYLFETLAVLIHYLCSNDTNIVNSFESALFGPFQQILSLESAEVFSSYVFQLMAQLLEHRTSLTPAYSQLFQSLLSPKLWENAGNVPALIKLFQSYLFLGSVSSTANQSREQVVQLFTTGTNIEGVLGIFQKLLTVKRTELEAIKLISMIIQQFPIQILSKYLLTIFRLVLQKLSSKPATLFTVSCMFFISVFIKYHSFPSFLQLIDSIQQGMFYNLLDKLLIPHLKLVNNFNATAVQRKVIVVGFTDILTKSNGVLTSEPYLKLWPIAFVNVIAILENTTNTNLTVMDANGNSNTTSGSSVGLEDEDLLAQSDKAFQTAYSKLIFANQSPYDPFYAKNSTFSLNTDDSSLINYFVTQMNQIFAENPGRLSAGFNSLDQNQQNLIKNFAQKNKLNIQ